MRPGTAHRLRHHPVAHDSSYRRSDAARRAFDLISCALAESPDGRLPSEDDLVRDCGESRNAIREALHELHESGLVTRERGLGTAVVPGRERHDMKRIVSLEEGVVGCSGRAIEALSITVEHKQAPKTVQRVLDLEPGAEVVYAERLMSIDGEPMSLRGSWLRADLVAGLQPEELALDTVDLVERVLGLRIGLAEIELTAVLADARVGRLLGIRVGAPILRTRRLIRDAEGVPVEFGFSRNRADRLSFATELPR